MKKLFASFIVALALAGAAYSEAGLYVTPAVDIQLGIGNYFRGGALSGQAIYDLGGIGAGLEVKFDYDTGFSNANIPLLLVVSFGPGFYLMAGQTVGLGTPYLTASDGSKWNFAYGGLPNTYGLGLKVARIDIGFAKLALGSEIFYTFSSSTATGTLENAVGNLAAMFAGLKAGIFGGLEFKFL